MIGVSIFGTHLNRRYSMKINFTKTSANGIIEKSAITKQSGTPIKVAAEPNTKLDVNIESEAKDKKLNTQKTTIKRQGNDMLIEADGEVLAEVTDLYVVDGASLGEVEWNFAAAQEIAVAETPEVLALESGASAATEEESASLLGGVGLWGLLAGGVAIAASGNGSSDPLSAIKQAANLDNATANTPALTDYQAAGITGVSNSNLAAINSILNDADINSASVDTSAELQTLVNSYNAILAAADGTAGNGTAPSKTDYANVGVNGIDTAAEVGLLGSVIDVKSSADVDTASELQGLADAVQAVMTTAAGGTPAVTKAQLELLGITGVTTDNLAAITQAIANTADNGSGVSSLSDLQAAAWSLAV